MSSREILFSGPSEEKDRTPAAAQALHGRPLSLHRKAVENTPSGSLKRPTDPLASPSKNQPSGSSIAVDVPLDAALSGDIPEPPVSVLVPELDPTNVPLPDASVSVATPEPNTESGKLRVNQSHNTISEHRSPRLNGERQRRAVKKFRPPDNVDTLTPEMGGHGGIRGRRALPHCDHQSGARSQGSSPGNGSHLASHSVSKERKINPGKAEETEAKKEEETSKTDDSR